MVFVLILLENQCTVFFSDLTFFSQMLTLMAVVLEAIGRDITVARTQIPVIGLVGAAYIFLMVSMAFWNRFLHTCETNCRQRILISLRFGKEIRSVSISRKQRVSDLKKRAAQVFGLIKFNGCKGILIVRIEGKIVRDDEMILDAAGISSNCDVLVCLAIRGGIEPRFDSIAVKNLRPLLQAIKKDLEEWKRTTSSNGSEWDGFSGSVQNFFKTRNINPCKDYEKFYSKEMRTVAVSYVWSATSIFHIVGKKP